MLTNYDRPLGQVELNSALQTYKRSRYVVELIELTRKHSQSNSETNR